MMSATPGLEGANCADKRNWSAAGAPVVMFHPLVVNVAQSICQSSVRVRDVFCTVAAVAETELTLTPRLPKL